MSQYVDQEGNPLWTIDEAAHQWGVSPRRVYKWIRGRLDESKGLYRNRDGELLRRFSNERRRLPEGSYMLYPVGRKSIYLIRPQPYPAPILSAYKRPPEASHPGDRTSTISYEEMSTEGKPPFVDVYSGGEQMYAPARTRVATGEKKQTKRSRGEPVTDAAMRGRRKLATEAEEQSAVSTEEQRIVESVTPKRKTKKQVPQAESPTPEVAVRAEPPAPKAPKAQISDRAYKAATRAGTVIKDALTKPPADAQFEKISREERDSGVLDRIETEIAGEIVSGKMPEGDTKGENAWIAARARELMTQDRTSGQGTPEPVETAAPTAPATGIDEIVEAMIAQSKINMAGNFEGADPGMDDVEYVRLLDTYGRENGMNFADLLKTTHRARENEAIDSVQPWTRSADLRKKVRAAFEARLKSAVDEAATMPMNGVPRLVSLGAL